MSEVCIDTVSTKPTITIEELAYELFPDELFQKDFQQELGNIYDTIGNAIEFVRTPIYVYDPKIGSRILHKLDFSFKNNHIVESKVNLAFYKNNGNNLLQGFAYIKPDPEPCLEPVENLLDEECLILKEKREKIVVMTSECKIVLPSLPVVQAFRSKMFERNIFFADIKNLIFLLEKFRFNPVILKEASRRFPKKGLMVIEINKAWDIPLIVHPLSLQFPRLINFAKKMDRIIKTEVSKNPEEW